MAKKDVYIYYSGATDKTGKALQTALKIDGGIKKPTGKKKIIIGWGTKTKEKENLNADLILNHPNNIKTNRNKFATLEALRKAGVNVANFIPADGIIKALTTGNHIGLPLIGRTKFHQGGKGLWTCLDREMVAEAIKEGAQYFQERIPIQDEYRLHIFDGTPIYAQKKTKRTNTEKAFIDQQESKIKNAAERGKTKLDKKTIDFILSRQAKEQAEHADMLVRSNTRGWKFSQVKIGNVKNDLLQQATNALKAIDLHFGAVDCCTDLNGKVWIIEINSGPGLEGTPFDIYVKMFEKTIKDIDKPKKAPVKKATASVVAKGSKVKTGSKKSDLQQKLALFQEMVEVADEDEAAALSNVASKMFGD